MLLGALMVLAPTGAGAAGNEDCPAGTVEVAKFEWTGSGYVEEVEDGEDPGPVTLTGTATSGTWTSTVDILHIIIKGATGNDDFVPADPRGGAFTNAGLPLNDGGQLPEISNVTFCGDIPDGPKLTVTKDVASTDEGALAAEFSIAVTQGDFEESSDEMVDGDELLVDPASGEYVISEVDLPAGWQTPTIDCGETAATGEAGGPWTVDVDDVDVSCTITNRPVVADTVSLTVSKDIASELPGPLSATFPVEVKKGDTVLLAASLGEGGSLPVIDPASGAYVITETLPGSGWNPAAINCGGAAVSGTNPWTVTVASTDVSCTITNTPVTPQVIVIPDVVVTPASLTVVKDVEGGDAVPEEWSEFIDVDNVGPGTTVSNIVLNDGDATETRSSLAPGVYVLDEIGSDIATMELTNISCSEANATAASSFALVDADDLRDGISVTLAQGSNVTCVFENTYTAAQVLPEQEEPGSITIVKAVEGPAPSDGWAFGFNVSDGVGRTVLTNADDETTFDRLDAGRYVITEDANSVTTLKSVVCNDPDAVSNGRTVTVDVGEGEDVECTFTNVFPAAQPAAEVKGDVVTRPQTLPRTGDETKHLAGAGMLLVALGAAMVLGSKRQLARR